MAKKIKVVLDTNVLVSAIIYGGKPRQLLSLILCKQIEAVTSPILLAELFEVLSKKFSFEEKYLRLLDKQFKANLKVVQPKQEIAVLKDEDDNRVLEAATAGKCQFIISGDKKLLELETFKGIQIISAEQFLSITRKIPCGRDRRALESKFKQFQLC